MNELILSNGTYYVPMPLQLIKHITGLERKEELIFKYVIARCLISKKTKIALQTKFIEEFTGYDAKTIRKHTTSLQDKGWLYISKEPLNGVSINHYTLNTRKINKELGPIFEIVEPKVEQRNITPRVETIRKRPQLPPTDCNKVN